MTTGLKETTNYKVLRRRDVCKYTGLAKTSLYRLIAAGKFPAQVLLGSSRSVGWYEHEIANWLKNRRSSVEQGS